ncbi:MAG TPA: sugar phosphate isomerase/epimerase [Acidisarcina sp.]
MKDNWSRREVIKSASAAAAASIVLQTGIAASPRTADEAKLPVRLGLTSYTFRNFTRAQLIGYAQQLKVTALNAKDVKDHLPMDAAKESEALADYAAAGIKLHGGGVIYFAKDEDEDVRSKFEYCRRAGLALMVAGVPAPEVLPRIERFAREYDIQVAIHNHGPEDKLWPSPLDVLKKVGGMDARIGCCMDVGHAARAGTNVVAAVHTLGARLLNIHMKDLTDFGSKESQVAVGEGVIPVRGLFEALIATRYKGFVDLEYEVHPDDPMPGVIESLAYMRGVIAGMRQV